MTLAVAAILLVLAPAAAWAQAQLTIEPAAPEPGAVVRIVLRAPGAVPDTITGVMAGEPLHFIPAGPGTWQALGAIPVDASRSVTARAVLRTAGRTDSVRARVAVPEVKVVASNLSVAPRFSRPMDSATAARVASENARAREVGRRSHATPRLWAAPFRQPRSSVITSRFGTGRLFNGVVSSRHLGVDFRGAVGEEVRAANRGVVALVDTFYLAGRLIYLDHGLGVVTAYFHLSETLVSPGDTVERGQIIGRVGESGRVTGPHLHWAARYGSLSVNPLDLVRLTSDRAESQEQGSASPPPSAPHTLSTSDLRLRRTRASSAPVPR
jgi:murein DD-endopeptidase MepM/ murein hydrolase activator NlpD